MVSQDTVQQEPLIDDEIVTLCEAMGIATEDFPFDSSGLTQAQLAALRALVAWIRTHPG